MSPRFDEAFWSSRWKEGQTGWNIGYPSTPLTHFIDSLNDHSVRILIPGAGNAYEAEYLWKKGFRQVYVMDLSDIPLKAFSARNPDFPEAQLIHGDFLQHDGEYDLILEQTFYCAIDPVLRDNYVRHMHRLLAPQGRLAGVLFNFPLTEEGPPFGGSEDEYRERFEPYFEIIRMEPCARSIPPRAGRELFIELEKMG
jgi:SAM-dependent methyltransferase